MKYIVIFVICFISLFGYSQNIQQRANGLVTVLDSSIFSGKAFRLPVAADTAGLNRYATLDSSGKMAYTRDGSLWLRVNHQWTKVASDSTGGGAGQHFPNGLISVGGITLVDSTVAIIPNITWRRNDTLYTTTVTFIQGITRAAIGYFRNDVIWIDSGNVFRYTVGIEDTATAPLPVIPYNGIQVTVVRVDGATITPPVPTPSNNFWTTDVGNNIVSGNFLGTTNNQPLIMKAAGVEVMRLTPQQYVQIGTTVNLGYKLAVESQSESIPGIYNSGGGLDPSIPIFYSIDHNGDTTKALVQSTNGVGIGIRYPSAKLDVNGTLRIRGNGATTGYVWTATDNLGNATWQAAGGGSGDSIVVVFPLQAPHPDTLYMPRATVDSSGWLDKTDFADFQVKVDSCVQHGDTTLCYSNGIAVSIITNNSIPTGTNFANTDLTATGDRFHNFSTHNLTIDSIGLLHFLQNDGLDRSEIIMGGGDGVTLRNISGDAANKESNVQAANGYALITVRDTTNLQHAIYVYPNKSYLVGSSDGTDSIQTKFGIGTSYPLAPLHVSGDNTISAIFINGNVGIGITTPAVKLHIVASDTNVIRTSLLSNTVKATDSMVVRDATTGNFKVTVKPSAGGSGTVTSVATGLGLSGGTITTSGTLLVDTASASIISRQRAAAQYLNRVDNLTESINGAKTTSGSWNFANTTNGSANTTFTGTVPGGSDNVGVLITGTTTGTTNAHSLRVSPTYSPTANGLAMAATDLLLTSGGTANLDHLVTSQKTITHGSSGTLGNAYNNYSVFTTTGGVTAKRYGDYIVNKTGVGLLTDQYGFYAEALTGGTGKNFAVYTAGSTASYLGGRLELQGALALGLGEGVTPGAFFHSKVTGTNVYRQQNNANYWQLMELSGATKLSVGDINGNYLFLENLGFASFHDSTRLNEGLYVGKTFSTKYRAVSTSNPAINSDFTLNSDATSGAVTATIATAVGCAGRLYYARKTDNSANTVTLDPNSSETITGANNIAVSTYVLRFQGESVLLQSDGANWMIVSEEIKNPSIKSRVSTQYDNTTTTLGNITGLTATVAAGKTYHFTANLYTTSNVAGGIKVAIAGTSTATNIIYEGLTTDAGVTTQSRATALATAVGAVTAVTAAYVTITGTITVNAAGTLTAQAAANAATGTTSVLVGSTFIVEEIL